ncbi:unnamed protein product [Discula destructiva]
MSESQKQALADTKKRDKARRNRRYAVKQVDAAVNLFGDPNETPDTQETGESGANDWGATTGGGWGSQQTGQSGTTDWGATSGDDQAQGSDEPPVATCPW